MLIQVCSAEGVKVPVLLSLNDREPQEHQEAGLIRVVICL